MSGRTKPRRRRMITGARDPIEVAIYRASKAPAATVDAIIGPVRVAFTALREGVATELQWAVLASSVNVALTIEGQGVVKGLAAHLKAAEQALHEIHKRAIAGGTWRATALYWQEIDAIDEFVPLHKFQLEQLSQGEVIKALDKAEATIRSLGGQVFDVSKHQAPQQQMALIGARA